MKRRARFVYLVAYGSGIYRAGLSVSETPSLTRIPRYLGACPVRLVGLWWADGPNMRKDAVIYRVIWNLVISHVDRPFSNGE